MGFYNTADVSSAEVKETQQLDCSVSFQFHWPSDRNNAKFRVSWRTNTAELNKLEYTEREENHSSFSKG